MGSSFEIANYLDSSFAANIKSGTTWPTFTAAKPLLSLNVMAQAMTQMNNGITIRFETPG